MPLANWLVLTSEPAVPWKPAEAAEKEPVASKVAPIIVPRSPVAVPELPVVLPKPVAATKKPVEVAEVAKPKLWSEIMASPTPDTSKATQATSAAPAMPVNAKTNIKVDNNTTAPSPMPKADLKPTKADLATTALSRPESFYQDKALRVCDMMESIYDQNLSFAAAATKHGFAAMEEAGQAMAVFGMQARRLLKDRKVYRDTMLLAMAKDKDGYVGRDMGEMYSEAWKERQAEDEAKKEKGKGKGKGKGRK